MGDGRGEWMMEEEKKESQKMLHFLALKSCMLRLV